MSKTYIARHTHLAWDEGIIAEIIPVDIKTTKTYCGKRVPMTLIDNKHYTCPECKRIKLQESLIVKQLQDSL